MAEPDVDTVTMICDPSSCVGQAIQLPICNMRTVTPSDLTFVLLSEGGDDLRSCACCFSKLQAGSVCTTTRWLTDRLASLTRLE
jgi:hypothetical protein